ncbi:MAG: transposase family protein [Mailhella sp.]|nr:transposase family protein [Mailhella sp.]
MLFLKEIPDPRYDRCKLHRLSHVIYMALFGWICGAKDWIDVWNFCDFHKELLMEELKLKNGIPSVSLFAGVSLTYLRRCCKTCLHGKSASIIRTCQEKSFPSMENPSVGLPLKPSDKKFSMF